MDGIGYSKVISELHKSIVELNSKHKMDIHNLHKSVSTHRMRTKGIGYKDNDKRLLTIKNPERLNTNDTLIIGEWGITYGGRDLSLDEDNYCWIVTNRKSGLKGYYIVERELIQNDWLNIRWGRDMSNGLKERKEVIDKKRLRDKDMIQRDMITAILRGQ
jgi:hypothetical protein